MTAAQSTALVTGGASGIGRALSLGLAARGFDLAVQYHRSGEAAREVVRHVGALGQRAVALPADLSRPKACRELIEAAAAELGAVRLLINNAAVFEMDRPDSVTDESWSRHMAINLRAPFLLVQAMSRQLGELDGMVVNLVDQRVLNPTPNFTSYTVSKTALAGLTRHLALALAPRLRVNAIAPGIVRSARELSSGEARLAETSPLGRSTDPGEIVAALVYLLDAPSVTGETLVLDAGMHLGWLHPRGRSS